MTEVFGPRSLGKGQKLKYHLISIKKSISKIFYTKPLFVFSQIKYIKHIEMPQGWDLWVLRSPGDKNSTRPLVITSEI